MSVIGLKKANCKNCYKCLKVCPVKSIKVENEQAKIIDNACILCGRCLAECPQNAKTLHSDLQKVKDFLRAGETVVASLAPAYIGSFDFDHPGQLAAAIKHLGFWGVSETSEGAAYVTEAYYQKMKEGGMRNIITTCCPSVNRLVELYYPDLVDYMAPVVSPMLAHARLLKASLGKNIRVVFIGPCISKKDEAADIRHDTDVDAVLTFDDLTAWLEEEKVQLRACGEASFLNASSKILRMYPVTDGIIASLHARGDVDDYRMFSVDGVPECKELFEDMRRGELDHCFVEVNACRGGCVNGPAKARDHSARFSAKLRVEDYAKSDADVYPATPENPPLAKKFFDRSSHEALPDEQTIRAILSKIGKDTPEQELNCGACGYSSCREKAIAVYLGRAELTMCVPYMKERAESLSNYVLSETPNITLIVDSDMNIIEFNKAAEECFKISRREALQKSLFELIDVSDFQFVFESRQSITDKKVHYREYNITTLQSIIYIAQENIAMGIFKDITREEQEMENRYQLRVETMEMAQKVIDKQMVAAQQIASLLGETTAETKVTLTKLKNMIVFDGDET
jgi:iron only hydrogenase large subunit-like protein/uncharacterized Fe-S cluster-containing protein